MANLSVDLPATGNLGITVGSRPRMHVRGAMCRLGVCAAKEVADRIGHQNADHTYVTEIAVPYQALRLGGMCSVVPGAADEELPAVFFRDSHQVCGFGGSQRHWFFNEHML